MMPFQLNWAEIEGHLHPSSPRPGESRLASICYEFDADAQRIVSIEVVLAVAHGKSRRLRFRNVWSNSLPGELRIPHPYGAGLLVVDVAPRQWESPILAVSDDEEAMTLFGADSVEDIV